MGQPDRRVGAGRRRGQALIEFAILMFVLVLLLAGGVELGAAGLSAYKVRDAADEGARQWARVVTTHGQADGATGVLYVRDSGSPAGANHGLGDHADPLAFDPPSADPLGNPDPGLPPDADDPATPALDGDIYLFNPRPIDVTNCTDGASGITDQGCVDRILAALPPIHTVLYSQYERRCLDAAGDAVLCRGSTGGGTAAQWLLRLPGRFDPAVGTVTLARLDENDLPETPPSWRTLQLQCVPPGTPDFGGCDRSDPEASCPCDSRAAPADVCWESAGGQPLACNVRVVARYRQQFYGLLGSALGLTDAALTPAALAELDLGVVNEAGIPVGGLGAEVVAQGTRTGNPSYFKVPWRTLQGCTSTRAFAEAGSLRTQLSACN